LKPGTDELCKEKGSNYRVKRQKVKVKSTKAKVGSLGLEDEYLKFGV
jgi:hypothetical protein